MIEQDDPLPPETAAAGVVSDNYVFKEPEYKRIVGGANNLKYHVLTPEDKIIIKLDR